MGVLYKTSCEKRKWLKRQEKEKKGKRERERKELNCFFWKMNERVLFVASYKTDLMKFWLKEIKMGKEKIRKWILAPYSIHYMVNTIYIYGFVWNANQYVEWFLSNMYKYKSYLFYAILCINILASC